jgi:gamma-glutamylcyclotransferase (GGCT)/AIG2-like uncharacterized protein YtfP
MDQEGMHRLFVYGALLDAGECRRLLGRQVDREPAHLDGYHRGRKRYFFVSRSEGARVDGAILSGLNDRDISILDGYEDVPSLYTRESVEATGATGKQIRCWIYLPTGWERG